MSNEQPRQFTYPKVYPLGQRDGGFWERILLPNLNSSFNGGNPRNGLSRKTRLGNPRNATRSYMRSGIL
jgi:hypothetical protein